MAETERTDVMIPYALLMITIYWTDGTSLEVRAVDLLADGVTIRVSEQRAKDFERKPDHIVCSFLDYWNKRYKKVDLHEFELERTEGTPGVYFQLTAKEPEFTFGLHQIVRDYMNYIENRQNYDEITAMERMTGVSLREDYPAGLSDWRKGALGEVQGWNETLRPVELAISLDTRALWEKFLSLEFSEFLDYYWKDNGLSNHDITKYTVTHIYIGNPFCQLLIPERTMLEQMLNRVEQAGMTPVVVFGVMPESLVERNKGYLQFLSQWAKKREVPLELVLNDLGMALQIREMKEHGFVLTGGTLLTKRKKDPRIVWRDHSVQEMEMYRETSIDRKRYRAHLKETFGIERISYETCGYDMQTGEDVLHLPAYQTNTATWCTLRALCSQGKRGRQKGAISCPGYCEHTILAYPKGSGLIGRWNSVFGISSYQWQDVNGLNHLIDQGIRRLVVRV